MGIRRFITGALLLSAASMALYLSTFWVLCTIGMGGTPLIYRCSAALNWKGGNSYQKFSEFDPQDRYDLVFIGSSHAYRGYDPALFEQRGHHAFNLGTSAQSPMNSYHIIASLLDSANCGLLLFDTYEVALEIDGLESTADLVQNISSDRAAIGMALALHDPRAVNMLTLRWMRRNSPPMYVDSTYLPGGSALRTDSVKGEVHYLTGRPLEMRAMQQRYLECCIEHCHRAGIPMVLVSHPYPTKADRARHAAFMTWLRDVARPHDVPVYDFAFDHGLPLDDEDHFYDHNHLNRAGLEIYDRFVIDRLERDGILRP